MPSNAKTLTIVVIDEGDGYSVYFGDEERYDFTLRAAMLGAVEAWLDNEDPEEV